MVVAMTTYNSRSPEVAYLVNMAHLPSWESMIPEVIAVIRPLPHFSTVEVSQVICPSSRPWPLLQTLT